MALLPLPEPYDFELSTERFRLYGRDLANLWHNGGLHRVIDGRELRIEQAAFGVHVAPLDEVTRPVVRKLLGADWDVAEFVRFALDDETLVLLVPALRGFRPPLAPDPFEALVTSVTAQQVSLKAAFAIRNRLIERLCAQVRYAYPFPTAERLAEASVGELCEVGLSRRKAECVLGVARAGLDFEGLSRLPDDEVKAQIRALDGLGEWTADWFLARHLGRPQAWPAGDLGLRKAVSAFCLGGREASIDEVRALGLRFAPFQNLAAHYLLTGHRRLRG